MKILKIVTISTVSVMTIVISYFVGYTIMNKSNKISGSIEQVMQEEKVEKKEKIKKGGVIKYNYKLGNKVIDYVEKVPNIIEGMEKEEFSKLYKDYEIEKFSSYEIVVNKEIEEKEENYILGVKDGYVAVYYKNNENTILLEQSNIKVNTLPSRDKKMLTNGIPVKNKFELAKIMEDYGS